MAPNQLTLPIVGMKSEMCAALVAAALQDEEHVVDVAVSFRSGTASIGLLSEEKGLLEIVSCLRQAGYDVDSKLVVLPIEGMSCVACTAHVQWALEEAAGVIEVTVDLAAEEASVSMVAGQGSLENLQAAVEEAGYRASIEALTNGATSI